MFARWPHALLLSTLLHAAIAVCLVLLGYSVVQRNPPLELLQLVKLSAPVGASPTASTSVQSANLALSLPTPRPLPVKSSEAYQPAETQPEPRGAQPTKPISSQSDRVRAITKSEFDARNGKGRPTKQVQTPKGATIAVTRIDTSALVGELIGDRGSGGRDAVETKGVLGPYLQHLEAGLGADLERVPGLNPGLFAVAEYHIMPDGALTRVRLLKGSGDDVFDAALVETIQSYNAGPRPAGVAEVHRTDFRTRAR